MNLRLLGLALMTSVSLTYPAQPANPTPVAGPAHPGQCCSIRGRSFQDGKIRTELYYQRDPANNSPFSYQDVRLRLYRQG